MVACRYGIILLVFNSIAHEWAQRRSELSSWTNEEKLHINARPCIIPYENFGFVILSMQAFVSETSVFRLLVIYCTSSIITLLHPLWNCNIHLLKYRFFSLYKYLTDPVSSWFVNSWKFKAVCYFPAFWLIP